MVNLQIEWLKCHGKMMSKVSDPEDVVNFRYEASAEGAIAIARALSDIMFMRKMERLMPLVAKELIKAGVDFSKVKLPSSQD